MSSTIYVNAALVVGALCGAAIGLSVAYKFACWLGITLWDQGLLFIEFLNSLLVYAACMVGAAIKSFVTSVVKLAWTLAVSTVLFLVQPVRVRLINIDKGVREHLKLRQLYWKYGYKEFDSFAAFKESVLGGSEQDQQQPSQPQGSYAEAQAVLGFTGDEPLTQTDLKVRYRKMISILHTDNGFPNTVFAQQLNHAVGVIKKVKKWK